MSRHNEMFLVPAPYEQTQLFCEQATAAFTTVQDWQPAAGGGLKKTVKQGWGLFHNPAKLEVEVTPADGACRVSVEASSIGFGPVQDANVKNAVREVRTIIESLAPGVAAAAAASKVTAPQQAKDTAPNRSEGASEDAPRARHGMTQRLFVSYRREDSADVTGRICDALERQFGAEAIFRDVDSIPLGVDFRAHLGSAIQSCHIVLAVIGRDWLGAGEAGVARRIDDPTDFVRVEIESAIQRDIPVIPLLVNRAVMPRPEQLPAEIAALAYRNGMAIRHDPDFRTDVARLCQELREALAKV